MTTNEQFYETIDDQSGDHPHVLYQIVARQGDEVVMQYTGLSHVGTKRPISRYKRGVVREMKHGNGRKVHKELLKHITNGATLHLTITRGDEETLESQETKMIHNSIMVYGESVVANTAKLN